MDLNQMDLTRDKDIRKPLEGWLKDIHRHEPETAFIHELKVPRPAARVDLAVINGEMIGYEIKSDLDRLDRLNLQVPAFSNVFEKINLVTTRKHLAAVRTKIPRSWGIIIYQDDSFLVKRTAKKNTKINFSSLLYSLTIIELRAVCKNAKINYKTSWSKTALIECMARSLNQKNTIPLIRDEVRKRNTRS